MLLKPPIAYCINSTLRLSMETDDGVSIKGLPEYCFSGVWRRISLCMERLADTEQKLVCKQLEYDESGEIILETTN